MQQKLAYLDEWLTEDIRMPDAFCRQKTFGLGFPIALQISSTVSPTCTLTVAFNFKNGFSKKMSKK